MNRPALTLYFDGLCPFCAIEMRRLGTWDKGGKLAFVDIALPGFDPAPLNASMQELNLRMVSQTADGRVLIGTDGILAAYTLVGRGWLVWPLRVPLLRDVLSMLYGAFARNRYTISRWLGYKSPVCADGVCERAYPYLKKEDGT